MGNLYKVTTEGDCEGKSTKKLGIWEGTVSDIAFQLANKMYYSLNIEPVTINKPSKITKEKVEIVSWQLGDKILEKEHLGEGNFSIEKVGKYSYKLTIGEEAILSQKRVELLKEKERIEKELRELNG